MAQQPEIRARVTLDGTQKVHAALLALGSGSKRMQGSMRSAASGITSDFGKLTTTVFNPLRSVISQIAKATAMLTLGGMVAGAAALVGTMRQVKTTTVDTAREISRLKQRGEALGLNPSGANKSRASLMGGLESMLASAAGLEDGDNVKDIISTLNETVQEANRGDEAAIEKLDTLGLSPRDFYRAGTDDLKEYDEILKMISDRFAQQSDKGKLRGGLIGLWGDEDGIAAAAMFSMTRKEMDAYLEEYARLVDIRQEDEVWSKRLTQAKTSEKAAWMGLSTAVGRGYSDSLTKITGDRTEFLVSIRPALESVARVFGEFGEDTASRLETFFTRILTMMNGTAGNIESGPLPGALEKVSTGIDWVLLRVEELAEYMITGDTDVPWLKAMAAGFTLVKDSAIWTIARFSEIHDYMKSGETDVPWVTAAVGAFEHLSNAVIWLRDRFLEFQGYLKTGTTDVPWVANVVETFEILKGAFLAVHGAMDTLMELFGIDTFGEKAALTIGLFFFGRTIVSVLGLCFGFIRTIKNMVDAARGFGDIAKRIAGQSEAVSKKATSAASTAADAIDDAGKKGKGKGLLRRGAALAGRASLLFAGFSAVGEAKNSNITSDIIERGKELGLKKAETEGENAGKAFGAAYIRAGLDKLRAERGDVWLATFLKDWGYEGLYAQLDETMQEAVDGLGAEVALTFAQDGVKQSYQDLADTFGWKFANDGQVQIGAGLSISAFQVAPSVFDGLKDQLKDIPASIKIAPPDLSDLAPLVSGGGSMLSPNLIRELDGLAPGAGMQPINLNFLGTPVGQVFAPPSEIPLIEGAAARLQRTRS